MKLKREEVPRHFEALRLKTTVLILGWPLVVAAALAGVLLASRGAGSLLEVAGVAVAAGAALLAAVLVRCRTVETLVGERLVSVGTGPLRRRIPVGLVERIEARAARSWRRLYADTELELTLSGERGSIAVPTGEPDELADALRGSETVATPEQPRGVEK